MDSLQLQIADIANRVGRERRCAVRIALIRRGDDWIVGHLDVRVSDLLQNPQPQTLKYPSHAFLFGTLPGKTIGTWIKNQSGSFRGYTFSFDNLQTTGTATRRRSREAHAKVHLPQPFWEYDIHGRVIHEKDSAVTLIANGLTHFNNWKDAAMALLFDDWRFGNPGNLPSSIIELRIAIRGPWLGDVHFAPGSLIVSVNGVKTNGYKLQAIGPDGPILNTSIDPGDGRSFTMSIGSSDGGYRVVLHRGSTVIDEREAWMHGGVIRPEPDMGITVEPPTYTEQARLWIESGEGPTIEFKLHIEKNSLSRLDHAVSAFANTAGGVILIGVGKDRATRGFPTAGIDDIADDIMGRLRQNVHPFPEVRPEIINLGDDVALLALLVPSDGPRPIGVGRKTPIYFIRRGANNYQATPQEVGDAIRAQQITTTRSPWMR